MIATVLAPLMWLVVLTRAWRWWWSRGTVLGITTVALSVIAVHLTLITPHAESLLQAAIPAPNFSNAIRMILFNFMAAAAGAVALAIVYEPERVVRWAKSLVVTAVLGSAVAVAIFVATPPQPQVSGGFEFDLTYSHLPGYAEAGMAAALFAAFLCPALLVMTVRPADLNSITGWSLALLSLGLAMASAWAWIRLGYFVAVRYAGLDPNATTFEVARIVSGVAVFSIIAGMLLAPIATWFRARRVMGDLQPLHTEMVRRWPGVVRPSPRGSTAEIHVADRMSEVLDALSMEMTQEGIPAIGRAASAPETAAAVATWLVDEQRTAALGCESIRHAAQQTATEREWALMLAVAYWSRKNGREQA